MSTASRVVPATSLTMARGSLTSALISEDFPTLGRPTMARRVGRDGFDRTSSTRFAGKSQPSGDGIAQLVEPAPMRRGNRDRRRLETEALKTPPSMIGLLVAINFVRGDENRAMAFAQVDARRIWSSGVRPSRASTTKMISVAAASARSTSRAMASPESFTVVHADAARIDQCKTIFIPARGGYHAIARGAGAVEDERDRRARRAQLKRADLPTFGRPTIATVCSIIPDDLFGRLRRVVWPLRCEEVQSLRGHKSRCRLARVPRRRRCRARSVALNRRV